MNKIWKSEMPYEEYENDKLSFDDLVYCFDGHSIKLGRFDSKNGVPLYISAFDGEQLECYAWCWKEEFENILLNVYHEEHK